MSVEKIYYDRIQKLEQEVEDLRTGLDWYKGAYETRKKKHDNLKQKIEKYIEQLLETDMDVLTHEVSDDLKTILKESQTTKKEEGKP